MRTRAQLCPLVPVQGKSSYFVPPQGASHFFWISFLIIILILLLIRIQEGDEVKIKMTSKIKRGTQKPEMRPHPHPAGLFTGVKGNVLLDCKRFFTVVTGGVECV